MGVKNDYKLCECFHTREKTVTVYNRYTGKPEGTENFIVGICYGTKEIEECNCAGNPLKCTFYPEVIEKTKEKLLLEGIKKECQK